MALSPALLEQKKMLRQVMRAERQARTDGTLASPRRLANMFHAAIKIGAPCIVSSYIAVHGEMDPTPLTDILRAEGHKIALPVIVEKRTPLIFRLYSPGDALNVNNMGISEPLSSAPLVEPDILLCPLLAFDKEKNRLGYGGGFYDCTIDALRKRKKILAVGLAYSFQEVADVPSGEYDMRLDHIVTETNIL